MKRGGPIARKTGLKRKKALETGAGPTRSTPLAPGKPPARGGQIRRRNPERAAAARAEDFGPLADAVRGLPCCVAGCRRTPSDPAHVRGRGAGGSAWIEVDGRRAGNIAPLCRAHHTGEPGSGVLRPQHVAGRETFERENRLELRLPGVAPIPAATLAEIAALVGEWFTSGPPPDERGLEW